MALGIASQPYKTFFMGAEGRAELQHFSEADTNINLIQW
jgi:hypothetical protein